MRRHFIFFSTSIPPELSVQDASFAVVSVDTSVRNILRQCCETMPQEAATFEKAPHISAIFLKINVPGEKDAFRAAFDRATALLDVFSLATFDVPKLVQVSIAATEGEAQAKIGAFGFDTTARAFIGDVHEKFVRHGEFVVKKLLPALNVAAGLHPRAQTELSQQLNTLAKMYRHGRLARDLQMQFLAKFSAMEGLVCGSTESRHGKLLQTRLPELFKARLSVDRVEELWKLRCRASHAGAGNWYQFAAAMPDVELLVLGCAIFAAAHVDQVETIEELWKEAKAYELPSELFGDIWNHNAVQGYIRELGFMNVQILGLDRIYGPGQP
jgi:hypothetical protein